MGAEIPEGYKETPVGVIPEEWKVAKLGDKNYFKVIMGQSPSSSTYNGHENGLPFLQGNADFGYIYPCPSLYCSNPIKIAEKNDILISVRAPVGEVNLSPTKVCIGRGLSAIRPKNGATTKFFFYYLKVSLGDFNQLSSGSTFKAINKTDIESYFIPLPPLLEQRKIAAILSSVDAAIQETDAVIAQTEQVKRGLMQELFTKGIGHTEFEETNVGRIPVAWKVVKIKDVCSLIVDCPHSTPKFTDSGVLVIRTPNVREGSLDLTNPSYISEEEYKTRIERATPQENDILFTREAPIGETCIVPPRLKLCLGQRMMLLRPNKSLLNSYYLKNVFYTKCVRSEILFKATGLTAKHINVADVKRILMPFPPLPEQCKIATILSTADEKLGAEREHRAQLETMKRGLMQDLLTGKKRVKVDGHA